MLQAMVSRLIQELHYSYLWSTYPNVNTEGKSITLAKWYLTVRGCVWSCSRKCIIAILLLYSNASSLQIDHFTSHCLWTDCCPQNATGRHCVFLCYHCYSYCLFFIHGTGTCSLCPSVKVHNPSFYSQQKWFFVNIQICIFCELITDDRNFPKDKDLTKSKHLSQVKTQIERSWCSILKSPRNRLGPGSPSQWYSQLLH